MFKLQIVYKVNSFEKLFKLPEYILLQFIAVFYLSLIDAFELYVVAWIYTPIFLLLVSTVPGRE